MINLILSPDTREGHLNLATEQLKTGQARITLLPSKDEENATLGAASKREPVLPQQAADFLGSHYLTVREGSLRDSIALSQEASHRRALELQLKSTIPYYLNDLISRLKITLSGAVETNHFIIAEPLNTATGTTRGHYTAPFPVVDESGTMRFMQHGTSTLLHEVVHALGKLTFSFSEDGNSLYVRQSGLSFWKRFDPNHPVQNRRLFGLFDEALASITQADFLLNFMGFCSITFSLETPYPNKKLMLNGKDIWPALEDVGLVKKGSNGVATINLNFERLFQGESIEGKQILERIRNIKPEGDYSSLPLDQKKAIAAIRDRQFLYHDSSYGVLSYYVQILAQELWPKLSKQEAREALHSSLLSAQVSGDLRPVTRLMKESFRENAGLYIRALANISQLGNSDPQMIAFVAFTKAGLLPPERRDSVRKLLATALLKSEMSTSKVNAQP